MAPPSCQHLYMSTKIYNGFIIPGADLDAAYELARRYRQFIREWTEQATIRYCATACIGLIDTCAWEQREVSAPLRQIVKDLVKRQMELRNGPYRDPEIDFQFSVCFLPRRASVYGIVYTEQRELLQRWMEQPGVLYYGFWNNADRPDGVSSVEWMERAQVWDDLLPGARTPAEEGLTADCSATVPLPTAKQLLPAIPSMPARIDRIARDLVINMRVADELKDMPDISSSGLLIRMALQAHEWLSTAAGQVELASIRSRVRERLPQTVTPQLLTEGLRLSGNPVVSG